MQIVETVHSAADRPGHVGAPISPDAAAEVLRNRRRQHRRGAAVHRLHRVLFPPLPAARARWLSRHQIRCGARHPSRVKLDVTVAQE